MQKTRATLSAACRPFQAHVYNIHSTFAFFVISPEQKHQHETSLQEGKKV